MVNDEDELSLLLSYQSNVICIASFIQISALQVSETTKINRVETVKQWERKKNMHTVIYHFINKV